MNGVGTFVKKGLIIGIITAVHVHGHCNVISLLGELTISCLGALSSLDPRILLDFSKGPQMTEN